VAFAFVGPSSVRGTGWCKGVNRIGDSAVGGGNSAIGRRSFRWSFRCGRIRRRRLLCGWFGRLFSILTGWGGGNGHRAGGGLFSDVITGGTGDESETKQSGGDNGKCAAHCGFSSAHRQ